MPSRYMAFVPRNSIQLCLIERGCSHLPQPLNLHLVFSLLETSHEKLVSIMRQKDQECSVVSGQEYWTRSLKTWVTGQSLPPEPRGLTEVKEDSVK
jgi:hypothetical protein